MFCPRCGAQNTDTTKYCRQCGLPMSELTTYVSTGGTGMLTPKPSSSALSKITDGMSPKQMLILKILLFVFAPGLLAVIADGIPFIERLVPLSGIIMVPGIIWAIFAYKAQKARIQQQTAQAQMYQPPQYQQSRQPVLQPPQQPVAQPLPPQPTNPLADSVRGSVTEDETRRLENN